MQFHTKHLMFHDTCFPSGRGDRCRDCRGQRTMVGHCKNEGGRFQGATGVTVILTDIQISCCRVKSINF